MASHVTWFWTVMLNLWFFWKELWKRFDTYLCLSTAYHPQTDGQTKVVNCTLDNMLHCVIAKQTHPWDTILPQMEFAYNSSINYSTEKTPFSIVYTKEPNHTVDLVILPKNHPPVSADILLTNFTTVINDVRKKLAWTYQYYKTHADSKRHFNQFHPGDLVMVQIHKERLPPGVYSKLKPK